MPPHTPATAHRRAVIDQQSNKADVHLPPDDVSPYNFLPSSASASLPSTRATSSRASRPPPAESKISSEINSPSPSASPALAPAILSRKNTDNQSVKLGSPTDLKSRSRSVPLVDSLLSIPPPPPIPSEESLGEAYPSSTVLPRGHRFLQQKPSAGLMSRPSHETDYEAPSVFEKSDVEGESDEATRHTQPTSNSPSAEDPRNADGTHYYDLKAPAPTVPLSNIELLVDRLFSDDHLRLIIRDAAFYHRFLSFLHHYRPQSAQVLERHVEVQKAITAIDYANAVVEGLRGDKTVAAMLDQGFQSRARSELEDLVTDALPSYITHRLVQIVTETLVKEITGQNTPLMRELVHGLAEVYCLTDPSLPDNPIVYASEEFFRTTQYGKDYTIGRNCRFLQGPKSANATIARLAEALAEGTEICETVLNYRRDGSPFVNLLMIAPLYDNRGAVRYFIGAQIDVNGLIEGGRGLESFERLLVQDRSGVGHNSLDGAEGEKSHHVALAELSGLLNDNEMEVVKKNSRRTLRSDSQSGTSSPVPRGGSERRFIGMEDQSHPTERNMWPAPHLGSSGRLPGVFQNYLLVRPYPSLRITFTSPALRIPGLLQSKFMERIGGPSHVRDGVLSALSAGVSVTARVNWLSNPNATRSTQSSSRPDTASTADQPNPTAEEYTDDHAGKPRWLHCTPLVGSDGKVGVWMIVMVERETISGGLNVAERTAAAAASSGAYAAPRLIEGRGAGRDGGAGMMSSRYTGSKLYKEYLRREGRNDSLGEHLPSRTPPASAPPASAGSQMAQHLHQQQQQQQQQGATQLPMGRSPYGYTTTETQRAYGPPRRNRSKREPGTGMAMRPGTPPGARYSDAEEGSEDKAVKARVQAERAMAGEQGFREF